MSTPTPEEAAAATPKPPAKPPARPPVPSSWGRRVLTAVVVLAAVLALLVVGLRFALTTDPGRAGLMRAVEGVELGPVGKLHLEGLKGDVLGAFSVKRLTITDAQGVWLDAHDVAVRWSPMELLRRRAHVRSLHAADVDVRRRPVLKVTPPKPPSKPPVGFALDDLKLRLRTTAEASVAPGDWDVRGAIDYARSGAAKGRLDAASRLHQGDGLHLRARFGRHGELDAALDAEEAAGGGLAGMLGLPTGKVFALNVRAKGDAKKGDFTLRSRSGDIIPADATGAWSPQGAMLNGHVLLSVSRILAPFADRIGPEARFAVRAGPADKAGLQQLDARVDGALAHAHAVGPINFLKRSTPGLSLELQAADLSHWHHLATVGPTRMVGKLQGRPDQFTYAGRIAADRLHMNSEYELGHAEGPLTVGFDRKGLRVQGDLAGSRGVGKGLLLTLLGASPRVQADVAFPADHRLAVRSLHVNGANLKIDADGGQTLLGGFALKGRAQVASLAGWRPGAAGGLEANWTAAIGHNSHRWDLGFDAKGRGLKIGIEEADRLMGETPHLTGKAAFEDDTLTVPQFELAGIAARAAGSAGIGSKGEISADFEWSAKGPFSAGPVEVAGDPKGHGKFKGTFSHPEADLSADLASIDLDRLVIGPAHLTLAFVGGPDGMEGKASLTGPSEWGVAHANTAFRFADGGIALSDIVADAGGVQVSGAIALRDGAPSTADLKVAVRQGAFLAGGQLSGALKMTARPGGGALVQANLKGADLTPVGTTISVKAVSLTADGPLDRLPLRFAVESSTPMPYRVSGDGVLQATEPVKVLTLNAAGRVQKSDIRTAEPAVLRFGAGENSVKLHLLGAGGRADIEGSQHAGVVAAKAVLSNIALGTITDDYEGALSGTVSLSGKGARLDGRLDAKLSGGRAKDAPANLGLDSQLSAVLAGDRIQVQAQATNSQGLKSRLDIDVPAEAAADPFRIAIVRTKGVKGSFSADGELRPLWDLLVGGDRTLGGHVDASGTIAGTLNDLRVSGSANLKDGRFHDAPTGLVLQNLQMQARFADNAVDVTRFSGSDAGKGTVSGDGKISLQREGASSFRLKLDHFQLIANSLAKATASGTVTVVRDAQGHAALSGGLTVDRADITAKPPVPTGVVPMDVKEINLPVKEGQEEEALVRRNAPLQVALDVRLRADRGIFVRGRGLDAELSLDARVSGSTAKPDLTGTAHIVRGSYDFSGKRFDFDEAGVVRLGATPETIRLDLTARREDPALTATVRIVGTAAKPQITLSSVPVLPQDEVLSRVLFGVSASELSPFQAAQLASAVAGLASGGGFDVLGNLRQFAGLDRLAIGGDAAGATVSGGKYITPNIYIELTGAGQQHSTTTTATTDTGRTGSSAQVEWRVRRNMSLVGQTWTGGDTRLSVRFRKDYGVPKEERKRPRP